MNVPLPLFPLVILDTTERQRLWQAHEMAVVRSLGYALHPIPSLLLQPERFDPAMDAHCFRMVGQHWPQLSAPMQPQMGNVLGITHAEAARLLASEM